MRKTLFLLAGSLAGIFATTFAQDADPEAYRPRYHFSPVSGWMSDPNGMVFWQGEYHLCYQHMPNQGVPGTHWGHAVSRDLLHWEHLPIALTPDSLGFIYSGCAVADIRNTSGLGTAENPPLIALYTYHDPQLEQTGRAESQAVAYSLDNGRAWIKYAGNPVIPNPGLRDFRDPKVIWHPQSERWVMALAAGDEIRFYGSPNCLQWSELGSFGRGRGSHVGPWECPDLFALKVKGTNLTKWVLLVSVVDFTDTPDRLATATQYFIGDFDGKTFTSDQTETLWVDYGKDCYAGVTFDNEPQDRRVFVAWMHSHQYAGQARGVTTRDWSGAATFPREFGIVQTSAGYRLTSTPVEELAKLRGQDVKLSGRKVENVVDLTDRIPFGFGSSEIELTFLAKSLPVRYGIRLSNGKGEYLEMRYDRDAEEYVVDRTHAAAVLFSERYASVQRTHYKPGGDKMKWRLLLDAASAELFVGDGTIVFTNTFFLSEPFTRIELFSGEGVVRLDEGRVWETTSIRR